jgi:hypothetical protein
MPFTVSGAHVFAEGKPDACESEKGAWESLPRAFLREHRSPDGRAYTRGRGKGQGFATDSRPCLEVRGNIQREIFGVAWRWRIGGVAQEAAFRQPDAIGFEP